ncbi:MAG: hypothetical protein ACM3ZE_27105, partial [Myxococcales bacterium]
MTDSDHPSPKPEDVKGVKDSRADAALPTIGRSAPLGEIGRELGDLDFELEDVLASLHPFEPDPPLVATGAPNAAAEGSSDPADPGEVVNLDVSPASTALGTPKLPTWSNEEQPSESSWEVGNHEAELAEEAPLAASSSSRSACDAPAAIASASAPTRPAPQDVPAPVAAMPTRPAHEIPAVTASSPTRPAHAPPRARARVSSVGINEDSAKKAAIHDQPNPELTSTTDDERPFPTSIKEGETRGKHGLGTDDEVPTTIAVARNPIHTTPSSPSHATSSPSHA